MAGVKSQYKMKNCPVSKVSPGRLFRLDGRIGMRYVGGAGVMLDTGVCTSYSEIVEELPEGAVVELTQIM